MREFTHEVLQSVRLFDCAYLERLQWRSEEALEKLHAELRSLAIQAGFNVYRSQVDRYEGNDPKQGYTLQIIGVQIDIGFSGIMIHVYPEIGTVSALVVTCSGEDATGAAIRQFEYYLGRFFGAMSSRRVSVGYLPLYDETLKRVAMA